MTMMRRTKTHEDMILIVNNSFDRWKKIILLFSIIVYICVIPGSFYVVATPDNRSLENDRGNLPKDRHQPREEYITSRSGNNGDNNGSDDSNGIIQIIETEVWDASENVWKGAAVPGTERGNRWTNEKGHFSPSPAEVVPPDGWQFFGDWKIVVSSSSNGLGMGGSGAGGDSKGWEYQFQYLQPPRRRRIWLRSLTPTSLPPLLPKSGTQPSRIFTKQSPTTETLGSRTKVKKIQRTSRFVRTMQQIQDDWNYKGLGFNLYKSFIFPSSVGVAIRLPLSINFDTFDRNPAWPIISSSAAVFYPPMMACFLSTSVHVEWVKWMTKCTLGLIPRSISWILYRLIFPVLWTIATAVLFPVKAIYTLPPRPTKIPNGSWWTGRNIVKPQYNSEMSERLGCSVSYRWSKKRGYEFRISYWHAYLPTLLVYQQFLSQLQERMKGSIASGSSKISTSSTSSTLSSSASLLSKTQKKAKTNWWRKHTASLGVSTSGPIPDTPPISCSANLSLSGLYWGARRVMSTDSIAASAINTATGSRTSNAMTAMGGIKDTNTETDQEYEDRTKASTRVRTASIKKNASLS